MPPHGADVAVVGGGLSGLECACALLQGGREVLALESAGGQAAAVGADASRSAPVSRRAPHYVPAPSPLPAQLGGRSLRWHGVVLRLEDWALADPRWPRGVVSELTGAGAEGPGLYREIEEDLRRWAGGSLAGATPAGDRKLAEILREWGCGAVRPVPRAVRAGPGAAGAGPAYSPLERWRELMKTGGPARTTEGVEVVGLLVAGGRTTGLRVRLRGSGEEAAVACETVVLAAGALENTRLVAQALGDPTAAGARVNDHLVQGFCLRLPAVAATILPGEAFVLRAGDRHTRCNLFLRLRGQLLDAWVMGEQEPAGASAVSFDAARGTPWSARIAPSLSPADHRLLEHQQGELEGVWKRVAAALGLPARPLRFAPFLDDPAPFPHAREAALASPAGRPRTYSWPLGTVEHEAGCLPLGGPLDEHGKVNGVRGLYVVGPAVFPRAGAANPSLTTLALARRTARAIARA